MPVTESAIRTNFGDPIPQNPEWFALTQQATRLLAEEATGVSILIPAVVADWHVRARPTGEPIFELSLSDVPNDPKPLVRAEFAEGAMRDEKRLRQTLRNLWRTMLHNLSRRQAESIGIFIKGHKGE
jgi:hypothetical protein